MRDQPIMPIHALRDSLRLTDPYTLRALTGLETPLLGLAADDVPLTLPASADHVLVATGSGGGTTTVLRSLAAQAMALGARLDVIDPGGAVQLWATNLPDVTCNSRIAKIHDRLLLLAAGLKDGTRPKGAGFAGRQVVVIENIAMLADSLRQYWLHTRPETQLPEAPGVEALALLLADGPARGLQVFAGSPRRGVPGLDTAPLSEIFPTRILAAGGTTLWSRFAPEVWAIPPYSMIPGRMHQLAGRTATAFQALYLDDAQARAFARGTLPWKETA